VLYHNGPNAGHSHQVAGIDATHHLAFFTPPRSLTIPLSVGRYALLLLLLLTHAPF
jgi:hypothetical protein